MASKLKMNKDEAIKIANQIKQISDANDKAIKTLTKINQDLRNGCEADSQKAYEDCFVQMKDSLAKYTELLNEYSKTLKKVTNNTFNNDTEHAQYIRKQFGNK